MKEALVFDEEAGRIIVPSQTLAAIVSAAAEQAGARVRRYPRRSVSIDLSDEGRIEVGVVAPADAVLPVLAESVQRSIHQALSLMCELGHLSVDVAVEEID
jgi:hypothetical protein